MRRRVGLGIEIRLRDFHWWTQFDGPFRFDGGAGEFRCDVVGCQFGRRVSFGWEFFGGEHGGVQHRRLERHERHVVELEGAVVGRRQDARFRLVRLQLEWLSQGVVAERVGLGESTEDVG